MKLDEMRNTWKLDAKMIVNFLSVFLWPDFEVDMV